MKTSARPRLWLLCGMPLLFCTAHCEARSGKKSPDVSEAEATPSSSVVIPPVMPSASASAKSTKPKFKRKRLEDCPKGTTVTFEDETLERVVRRQLRKPSGPIATSELARVKTLDLSQAPKNDELDPCIFPHFKGLKGLYLGRGRLDDLSPLTGLLKLESLRIAATNVRDLGPLSGLKQLDRLDLGRTPVEDLRPIAGLTKLTALMLDRTEVRDLSPLAKMTKMEILNIKYTRVVDVSPLQSMRKLKHLYIEAAPVKNAEVLASLRGLRIHEGR